MTQAQLADYETGGTSNADRRRQQETMVQRPLHAQADAAATIDVPDHVGAFERATARHTSEIVRWDAGSETVSIIRVSGDGDPFEVSAADWSHPSPGRLLATATDRAAAVEEAQAYMRAQRD